MSTDREYELNIAIPNGLILLAIGLCELATPLFIRFDRNDLLINLSAGMILMLFALISLRNGLKNRRLKKKSTGVRSD